jgi:homoserine kinase
MGHRPVLAPVDDALAFVLLIPEFPTLTEDARRVLPGAVPFTGAVESCINAARISAAFVRRDYEALRGAFGDHLHQPYREPLVPFLSKVIAAAEKAGALGGWLSGSGSTICCITLGEPAPVAEAMLAAAASPGARVVITKADNSGCEAIAASKSTSTSPA